MSAELSPAELTAQLQSIRKQLIAMSFVAPACGAV